MHNILIIGCGSIGERHLRCFQKTGRVAVTGCDASAPLLATIAQTYGVPTATDWKQAVAQQRYDAAVICTPAHLHVAIATELLNLGLHVLVEKPLALTQAEVDAIRHFYEKTPNPPVLLTITVTEAAASPQVLSVGLSIPVIPTFLETEAYSSAPISGVSVLLVCPSISVVIAAIGVPLSSIAIAVTCKSDVVAKFGFTESELVSR